MGKIRKYLLRIHGTILIVVGILASGNATLGRYFEMGSYAFLNGNILAYVGLLQAYMLAFLTGIVLWMGSYQKNNRQWNLIGATFHFLILIVYVLHWNFFPTIPSGEVTRNAGVVFHLILFVLEGWFGFSNPNTTTSKT